MNSIDYQPVEGLFFVDIVKPTQEELDSYYSKNNEIKLSKNGPREHKKAIIKFTSNAEKFPVDSVWMMGESPGMTINFFGEKIIAIQEKDLYARIDKLR